MTFRYQPIKETLFSDEFGHYVTFGIKVCRQNNHIVLQISDVSTNEAFVSSLCRLCTEGQLDPRHLRDVIEDFL